MIRSGFALVVALCAVLSPCAGRAEQAPANAVCRNVEEAAHANLLPPGVLGRLIWVESRFQADAVSPAGAQGIAQFMPATAEERGLADPFAPDQAIRHAAELLTDLDLRFGNLGLSVAAYNAGPARVARWLAGNGPLPRETERYVLAVTGRTADEWAWSGRYGRIEAPTASLSCTALASSRFTGFTDTGMLGTVRGLEHSGRSVPEMQQSGRVLPGFAQSGRLLSGMERSGRPIRLAREAAAD